MGDVIALVKLYNPINRFINRFKYVEHKLLVDTGSTCTWFKRIILEELDVKPLTKWRLKTIDGRIVERDR